jgi:hypothetical protein
MHLPETAAAKLGQYPIDASDGAPRIKCAIVCSLETARAHRD